MRETRLEFWHRQTLREKPALILAEWKEDSEKLKKENEKLKEFVKDCSVSHHETRYKYRAQVILREISSNKELGNEKNRI